jgi:hypothetical protein
MAVVAAGAVLAPLTLAQPASAAKTYKACVKKSTGETRMLVGKAKKCKKGWKKVTWGKKAPTGDAGIPGAQGPGGQPSYFGNLLDGNGAVIGKAAGLFSPAPQLTIFQVLIDGGLYSYLGNGWLLPLASPLYLDAACAGEPFQVADDVEDLAALNGPLLRVVYRTQSAAGFGPSRVFKPTGAPASTLSGVPIYEFDSAGACVLDDPSFLGYRVNMTEISPLPDRQGPLRIG